MTAETSAPVVPEPQSLDAGTEYVILVLAETPEPGGVWREVGKASSRSADASIREVVGRMPEAKRKGQFVAVPARSWKPVTVSEKVERTLVIGS